MSAGPCDGPVARIHLACSDGPRDGTPPSSRSICSATASGSIPAATLARRRAGDLADARRARVGPRARDPGRPEGPLAERPGRGGLRRDVALRPRARTPRATRCATTRNGEVVPRSGSRPSPRGTGRGPARGTLMKEVGVLQGTYLGIYVSNSCMYWYRRRGRELPVLHDRIQRRRQRGRAEGPSRRRRGRRAREGRVGRHVRAPEHRLPAPGRPAADRALREGDQGAGRGARRHPGRAARGSRASSGSTTGCATSAPTTSRSATSSTTPRSSRALLPGKQRTVGQQAFFTRARVLPGADAEGRVLGRDHRGRRAGRDDQARDRLHHVASARSRPSASSGR